MTLLTIISIILLIVFIKYKFAIGFEYLGKESILLIFYSAENNERKCLIFKI